MSFVTSEHQISSRRTSGSAPARRRSFVAATVCGLFVAIACQTALAQPGTDKIEVVDTTIQTQDGWNLYLTYYRSPLGKEAPVVILLHMEDGNRLVWKNNFVEKALWEEEGYAVVAVDLRMHGESKPANAAFNNNSRPRRRSGSNLKPIDYQRMVVDDLEAVKQFLFEEHQRGNLNMRKTAIIAPGMSAAVALAFSALDWQKRPYNDAPTFEARTPRGQDVRALVLISPEESVPGVQTSDAVTLLREPRLGIAFLVAYGSKDKMGARQAEKIYKKLTAFSENEQRMYRAEYPVKLRGTEMLGKELQLEAHIIAFLDKHLKGLGDPWRDRKSSLTD